MADYTLVHQDANGGNVSTLTGVTWGTAGAAAIAGDVALLSWTYSTSHDELPSGDTWTQIGSTVDDSTCRNKIFKRICDGTESGDVGLATPLGATRQTACLTVWRGASDVDQQASAVRVGSGTSTDCPSITTGVADALVLVFYADRVSLTVVTTPPTGYTVRSEFSTGGSGGTTTQIASDTTLTGISVPASTVVDPGAWTMALISDASVARTISLAPTVSAVEGQGSAAFGFTGTASGVPRTPGTAAAVFSFTGAAAGVPRTSGAAAAAFGFTGTATGVDRALGVAVGSFGFTGAASGVDRALGVAVGSFGFTGSASGEVGAPPVTGVASAEFGFTGTASGTPRTLGAAVATFGFTGAADGVDRALGVAVGLFGFTGAAAGVPRTHGVAAAAFGFTGTASGSRRVFGVAAVAFGFTSAAEGEPTTPGSGTIGDLTGSAAGAVVVIGGAAGGTAGALGPSMAGSVVAPSANAISGTIG